MHAWFVLLLVGFPCCLSVPVSESSPFLSVSHRDLSFQGNQVFLNGANLAWINYGRDFGNNQTNGIRCELQEYVRNVSESGGNSMRVWLFVQGTSIPLFDSQGNVQGTDAAGSLVEDLRTFVRYAASQNVFVILCLWNGALMVDGNAKNLVLNSEKLKTFIDNALTPMVTALADEPGIGAWEIMNEPEGSVHIGADSELCFDTTGLSNTGAGWSKADVEMKDLLRFHNWQAAAIHDADPKALVTVGSWAEFVVTDRPLDPTKTFFNYYKDECLVKAGGKKNGVLDFLQVHTYPQSGKFDVGSPLSVPFVSFDLNKPLLIGEFASKPCKSTGCTPQQLYELALNTSYAGLLDWSLWGGDTMDNEALAMTGMHALAGDRRVVVDIKKHVTPPPDTCSCSDVSPSKSYTCSQQASFGKCGQSWMKGFCCRSCFACQGCSSM